MQLLLLVLLPSDAAAPAAALVSQIGHDLCSCPAASPAAAIATSSAAIPTPIKYLRVANLIQISNIHNILMMHFAVIANQLCDYRGCPILRTLGLMRDMPETGVDVL